MSWISAHHIDVEWCVAGPVTILYHASISVNISVTYDERSVFGSHGAYAVWTGTSPRSFSVSSNLVGANAGEVQFNMGQVVAAHMWTQENPPQCQPLKAPGMNFSADVRIESYDASIEEGVHLDANTPIQVALSLSLKECKAI
jgi:hypothetical protein